MDGNKMKYMKSLSKNRRFENLSTDRRKILKLVLKEQSALVRAGFIWLRIGKSGKILW
jgi:hypothetical protein